MRFTTSTNLVKFKSLFRSKQNNLRLNKQFFIPLELKISQVDKFDRFLGFLA